MSERIKMPIEERAKQFAPFSALTTLGRALAEKERIVVKQAEISEEKAEEINRKLKEIKDGEIITLVYFDDGEYVEITGMVAKIDFEKRLIRIVNKEIEFDYISNIKEG